MSQPDAAPVRYVILEVQPDEEPGHYDICGWLLKEKEHYLTVSLFRPSPEVTRDDLPDLLLPKQWIKARLDFTL